MGVYDTIINEKLLSDSVLNVLLGDSSVTDRKRLFLTRNLALMSKKICMLYSALIQIYVSGNAIYSSGEYVKSVNTSSIDSIKRCWNVDGNFDLAEGNTVFSFLSLWAMSRDPQILPSSAVSAVSSIVSVCEKLGGNNRYEDPKIEEKFLDLVKNLPLLAKAEFNFEKRKIAFNTGSDDLEFEYSPFIEFWDSTKKCSTKVPTDFPMILTSVRKGHSNNELSFNYSYLDKYYKSENNQTINKSINENEWLRLICNVFDIKTEWYTVKECYGDFAFLKHITDITYDVLTQTWGLFRSKDKDTNVFNKLHEMFIGSDVYDQFEKDRVLCRDDLRNYLYGVFIKFGVFRTFKSIFLEPSSSINNRELFKKFLDCIEEKGLSSKEERLIGEKDCENTIEFHLDKLKRFLSHESASYKKRSREIKAEWRAFTILKLSGMQTEKLFADMENIFSIDDYFEMIKNPDSSLYDDLADVVRFIVEFYGSLEKYYQHHSYDTKSYDEKDLQAFIQKKRAEFANADLKVLFDEFLDLVNRTTGAPWISKVLSRDNICKFSLLCDYRDEIFGDINQAKTSRSELEKNEAKYIFISYKHEKDDHVPDYIERLENAGISCVVDKNNLRQGKDWENWVYQSVKNPLCEAVCVFMSKNAIISDAVKFELSVAYEEAKERKQLDSTFDVDDFIIFVNLEEEDIASYLSKAIKKKNENAIAMRKALIPSTNLEVSSKKYVKWSSEATDFIHSLLKRVPLPDETGYVVRKHYNENELHVANFYGFLKYGEKYSDKTSDEIDMYFNTPATSLCVYPMVISVKETQIKRDNITLVGYEIISGSCSDSGENCYILTSLKLRADEYYCVPNPRTADDCSWMIEPLLISQDIFTGKDI